MDKTFNELFDEFFQRNNIKPKDKIADSVKEDAKKIIDMLTSTKNVDNINEEVEKQIDIELGKPDRIEFFNEGDVFFERRIWHAEKGDIIKLVVTDNPVSDIVTPVKQTLKEQLEKAVEAEEFEKAAAIRDLIKKAKPKRPRIKKK